MVHLMSFINRFTGTNPCVNPCPRVPSGAAGKMRRSASTFLMTRKPCGLGISPQGHLRPNLYQELSMLSNTKTKLILFALLMGAVFCPQDLWAHTGDLLKDEIDKMEKLFTGGYMRLGLLAVCGFAAIYGIIKQNGWIFTSGILGCVFAYFMKDWILKTFTMVI